MGSQTSKPFRDRLEEMLWERHSNPKSGWSRTLLGPLFVLALYRRDWRLIALAVIATVVNPITFPPPDPDTEDWHSNGSHGGRPTKISEISEASRTHVYDAIGV